MIGIDPGNSGGAVLLRDTTGDVADTLTFSKCTPHDIAEVIEEWATYAPEECRKAACIESVHSMPGQGRSSIFTFGDHFGMLKGFLIAFKIPYHLVTPQRWQRTMNCLSQGDKNVTKAAAQRRWPGQVWTHALADAALIAEYGRTQGVIG